MKVRYGRGFTLEELKNAGIHSKFAKTVGIAVDARRQDTCMETRDLNVKRLKAYLAKLILFPGKKSRKLAKKMTDVKDQKPRKQIIPDATTEKLKSAAAKEQVDDKKVIPLQEPKLREKPLRITPEMKAPNSFVKIRLEKEKAKYAGVRKKRAELAAKEAEEKATKAAA